jgi:hypothetical protein
MRIKRRDLELGKRVASRKLGSAESLMTYFFLSASIVAV